MHAPPSPPVVAYILGHCAASCSSSSAVVGFPASGAASCVIWLLLKRELQPFYQVARGKSSSHCVGIVPRGQQETQYHHAAIRTARPPRLLAAHRAADAAQRQTFPQSQQLMMASAKVKQLLPEL